MPPEKVAILKIESAGNVPLYKIRLFLTALEHAYNYVYVAQMLLDAPVGGDLWKESYVRESEKRFARWVPEEDRLILKSVELRSPGDWEFLGKLNPLEVIRLYLQDRHERRKDKAYREPAERRALELDNKLKEAQLLSTQIDTARKMGATDDDLRPMLERFIWHPLAQLDRFQDEGIAGETSVSEPEPRVELDGNGHQKLPNPQKDKR
jgi:hypothetical protein